MCSTSLWTTARYKTLYILDSSSYINRVCNFLGGLMEFKEYAKVYDTINSKKDYRGECEFVYRWAGMPERIFDIGCGTANYWKYFPVKPTGLEKSERMKAMSNYKDDIVVGDITQGRSDSLGCKFDCVFALFDVLNYIKDHSWWKNLPIEQGGYFIFDIWDSKKVEADGFQTSVKIIDGIERRIFPNAICKDVVELEIEVKEDNKVIKETHQMYIHSKNDIRRFCGNDFKMVDIVKTNDWQCWYKLVKL